LIPYDISPGQFHFSSAVFGQMFQQRRQEFVKGARGAYWDIFRKIKD